jgi:acetoacetate decarboxylase
MIQITTRVLHPAAEDEFIPIFPVYNLKMIPAVDKPQPIVKQITTTGIDKPKEHWRYKCAGSVRFQPTSVGEFWRLQPKKILGACRFQMDYEQGLGTVVYDYLADSFK